MSSNADSFRILVVDDEEQIIDILTLNFRKWGYEVESAMDGETAFRMIMKSPPDLLVTDIKMPKMTGLELIQRLKREGVEIPVVVITAYFDIDNAIQAIRLGALNFFKKPFDFRIIRNAIFKIEKMKYSQVEKAVALKYYKKGEISFVIPSNVDLIDGISKYITDRAAELGYISGPQKFYFQLAIDEAISNAILHGNLRIKELEERNSDGRTREELYRERIAQPGYFDKKVTVTATIEPSKLEIAVRDEGEGFDQTELPDPTDNENVFKYHGRGIFVIRNVMDDVRFNAKGNEITMVKTHRTDQ
jgi:DNA-binding response OmpR family regulator